MSCPSCFKEGHETFCKPCSNALFGKNQISHILPFDSPKEANMERFRRNASRMSISGVQAKYSLSLDAKKLKLTDKNGQYILKPIAPSNLDQTAFMPHNEHLCMQLAKQVYGLETAANALVKFKDGTPAYLVKRFDVLEDGSKKRQEDFAALAGKTPDKLGDFKYDFSYEGIAKLMKIYLPAYAIEVEKYFKLLLFNYIIGNGDAHLKNFSVSETTFGDHRLSPAYDLLCTKLHIPQDGDLALDFFEDDFETEIYKANGFYTQHDFLTLADRMGILPKRSERIIKTFRSKLPQAQALVQKSSLSKDLKTKLLKHLTDYIEKRLGYGL